MRRAAWTIGGAALIAIMGAGLSLGTASVARAQSVPPAGNSGKGQAPGVTVPAGPPSDPSAPRLMRLPDAAMADLIRVDPAYRRGTVTAHAKVVGAFAIAETRKSRLDAAWAPGFLPVTLSFSDRRCFALKADYTGGTLSNGRLAGAPCEAPRKAPAMGRDSPQPATGGLTLIGSAWSYDAWADARNGTTIIALRNRKAFTPLFTARMTASAIMAMDSPDEPMGNVTLIGRVKGRLTVLTLEAGY